MKRFIIIFISLHIVNFTFAVEPKYAHWSATIDVGTNFYDGDIKDTHTSFMDKLSHPSLGASVDYTIFPFVSLGFAYNYQHVQANNGTDFFNSNMQHFYPYLGLNLLNLAFKRNLSNFGLLAHVGFGLSKYNFVNQTLPYSYTDPYTSIVRTYYISNTSNGLTSLIIPYGFTLEYKISNHLSLGLQIDRYKYSKDNLEGINQFNWHGTTNDYVNSVLMQMRYKFCSKDKKHMRDCSWSEVF